MKSCNKALSKAKGIKEHIRLIKVLKTKKGLKKEVEEQKKDLKYLKK